MMSRNGTRGLLIGEAVGQKGASEIFIQCRTEEVSETMARIESCIEVQYLRTACSQRQFKEVE
jgi:hypothetical protein